MARFRRLVVGIEGRADIHLAFATLATALICLGQIRRFCLVPLLERERIKRRTVQQRCLLHRSQAAQPSAQMGHTLR
jgi:hypothetical protein